MDELNFNIYNVLILVGIIHGVIFSFIIFFNRKLNSKTNLFLAFTVLTLVFSNLQYWLKDVGLSLNFGLNLFIPFEFLMLPFFYFFVRSYLNKKIIIYKSIILFTPFVLVIIYQIIINSYFVYPKIIDIINLIIEYVSMTFSIVIIVLVFRCIIVYEKENIKYHSSKIKMNTKWLKKVLLIGLILCVLWFLSVSFFESFSKEGYYQYYPLWIGISILIYWIAYGSIFQTYVFNQRIHIRNSILPKNIQQIGGDKKIKYSNVNLFNEIFSYIEKNKLYLNPDLNVSIIANTFNISKGYLSRLISFNSELNFNDYINTLRVEEAKTMLNDKVYNDYTILAIGLESGFNSKTSFYSAFKKFTNKTPNQYKKESEIMNDVNI
ncbi:AraC family transcriptional regulator [Ichthyenterobacterium magnum]|uniref:AraC family transcriptional regulator n=2 Tax=Ichthyenterobacterium magnum TaxID=1230530 RepID=A0A420DF57_9FLAO|nr:AraC family transcriptional regulator [Ichthyenterobacterium magnum]